MQIISFCHHQINWEAITQVPIGGGLGNYLDYYDSSSACPTKKSCPDTCYQNNCWNNQKCQLFDTNKSNTNREYLNRTVQQAVRSLLFFLCAIASTYITQPNTFRFCVWIVQKKNQRPRAQFFFSVQTIDNFVCVCVCMYWLILPESDYIIISLQTIARFDCVIIVPAKVNLSENNQQNLLK